MTTIVFDLDPKTNAELGYLEGIMQKGRREVATEVFREAISRKYVEYAGKQTNLGRVALRTEQRPVHRGPSGQPVIYKGSDSRLKNEHIYRNYAEVLRIVRPDLAKLYPDGKLYNAKEHGGDKAENILKRYEPNIFKELVRQK